MPLWGSGNSKSNAPPVAPTLMTQLGFKPKPVQERPLLSKWSSPRVKDSMWAADSFMLGAGMVVFQVPSFKVVVIEETQQKYWFFPKGRKDIGESLETTALREAYEESGYRAGFLPVYTRSKAPAPPGQGALRHEPNTEAFYLSTMYWSPKRSARNYITPGGEYMTSWYIGVISEDAICESGTGMPDEKNYKTHVLDYPDALKVLGSTHAFILKYAFELVSETYPEITQHVYESLPSSMTPVWRQALLDAEKFKKRISPKSPSETKRFTIHEADSKERLEIQKDNL